MTRVPEGARRVLVVDADPALLGLLGEWLEGQGCHVVADEAGEERNDFDLVVVDVPFPRHRGLCQLKRVAERHPGVPILALSSSFFAGIARSGVVARALGVAGALPKPLAREPSEGVQGLGDLLRVYAIPDDTHNARELARARIPALAFYLIRPDGHVGLAGTRLEPDAVTRYLSESHIRTRQGGDTRGDVPALIDARRVTAPAARWKM